MDQTKYQLYLLADGVYFDTPTRMTEARFGIAGRAAPSGWVRRERQLWIVYEPDGIHLPEQGWKIHASATMDDCEETIGIVWDYCVAHGMPFKFLRSRRALLATNGKHAARGASGKLLTLYPSDDTMLAKTLTGLAPLLRSQRGPYILGDLRYEDGPLYVRYGAFSEMYCPDENGEPTFGMRGPGGRIVPDRRGPVFAVPDWVTVPDVLRPSLLARTQSGDETLPYTIEAPLHFTNGGGLYRATDPATGADLVLREARPHAGLDADGVDAVTRLRSDRDLRARLAGLDCVPGFVGYHTVWEHEFLAEEFIEGRTLFDHIIEHYPFAKPAPTPEEIDAYLDWFETVTARISEAVDQLHARGVRHGDLHPDNILVRDDGRVVLVDLELASDAAGTVRAGLRTQGFAPPTQLVGMDADRYALACIRLYGRMPLTQMIDRDPAKVTTLFDAAQELWGPADPGQWRAPTKRVLTGPLPAGGVDEAAAMFQAEPLDWPAIRAALVAGIHASATPDRTDRLFPGDVPQFVTGGISLRNGAAGVLYALHRAQAPIPAEYVDWLMRAARAPQRGARVGLLDGRHGVALLLEELGRSGDAAEILALARRDDEWAPAAGLLAGRAGIALSLLRLGTRLGEASIMDDGVRYGDELVAMLKGDGTQVRLPAVAGLTRGLSGVALALLRIYECTGDIRYLDAAETALQRDLDQCVTMPDGSVHLYDGSTYLTYLSDGSGGIAVALRAYLCHRANPAFAEAIDGARRSCRSRFVFQPGLFRGRAGIIAVLNHLGGRADHAVVIQHVRDLGLHAVAREGGLAFPGAWLLRHSADLGTGSAGVLLALLAVFEADPPVLPFLEPVALRIPRDGQKEVNHEHSRPAGS